MAKSARERYEERLRVSAQILCSNLHVLGLASDETCDYVIGLADLLIAKLEKDLVEGEAAEAKHAIGLTVAPVLRETGDGASLAFRCYSETCPHGLKPGGRPCTEANYCSHRVEFRSPELALASMDPHDPRFRCVSTRCPKGVGPGEKICYYGNCIERRDA